jgi:hypothetical protein
MSCRRFLSCGFGSRNVDLAAELLQDRSVGVLLSSSRAGRLLALGCLQYSRPVFRCDPLCVLHKLRQRGAPVCLGEARRGNMDTCQFERAESTLQLGSSVNKLKKKESWSTHTSHNQSIHRIGIAIRTTTAMGKPETPFCNHCDEITLQKPLRLL